MTSYYEAMQPLLNAARHLAPREYRNLLAITRNFAITADDIRHWITLAKEWNVSPFIVEVARVQANRLEEEAR